VALLFLKGAEAPKIVVPTVAPKVVVPTVAPKVVVPRVVPGVVPPMEVESTAEEPKGLREQMAKAPEQREKMPKRLVELMPKAAKEPGELREQIYL
jgi:hypothetical protein